MSKVVWMFRTLAVGAFLAYAYYTRRRPPVDAEGPAPRTENSTVRPGDAL
jgi:hypothetical protein